MILYFSPSTRQFFARSHLFGCMFNVVNQIGSQDDALEAGCLWMLDNGQFKNKWTWPLWWYWLNRLLPYRGNCFGIVVPDKYADAPLTLHFFKVFSHIPREMGYPVALVTQDGMTPGDIPWPGLDVLFIGGSDYHKRGREAELLGLEAKRRGKRVHIGRVQAGSTMLKYWPWADSWDGTTFAHHPTQQLESISGGVAAVQQGGVPYTGKLF